MSEPLSRTVTNLRKAGKLPEAWDLGCPAVQANPNDTYLKGAFFWVCYDYLKRVQEPIKERAQKNSGNLNPTSSELERINFLLDWVIWLNIPPGGFEYRSLLLLFQKNIECIPKLVLLLIPFGSSLFEAEDKIPYQSEMGESPSLMLKFARKVAKSWMEHEQVRKIGVDPLLLLFDQTRKEGRDQKNLIWLDYDQAKCLVLAGRYDQARELVIPLLRKKQNESWAWGALAATYRKEDANFATMLLCKGLVHARDEKFALPLLKGVAPLLASTGHVAEASMCIKRAVSCYEKNGWKVKADLERLSSQPWFDNTVDTSTFSEFMQTRAEGALDLLYGPAEQCVAVVSNIHKSGKGFHAYRDHKCSYSVRLGLYKAKDLPLVGSYVLLKISAEDGAVITAEPCNAIAMNDVGSEQGEIRVAEKGFGFVNDIFIPPNLVTEGIDGQIVNVIKILNFDKTKNKLGWKAITLELVGNV